MEIHRSWERGTEASTKSSPRLCTMHPIYLRKKSLTLQGKDNQIVAWHWRLRKGIEKQNKAKKLYNWQRGGHWEKAETLVKVTPSRHSVCLTPRLPKNMFAFENHADKNQVKNSNWKIAQKQFLSREQCTGNTESQVMRPKVKGEQTSNPTQLNKHKFTIKDRRRKGLLISKRENVYFSVFCPMFSFEHIKCFST